MICTETGAWSDAKTHGGGHIWQSAYLVQSSARAAAADIALLVWFNFVDFPEGVLDYGLYTAQLQQKLALQAFELVAQLLRGAVFVGPIASGELPVGIEGYLF